MKATLKKYLGSRTRRRLFNTRRRLLYLMKTLTTGGIFLGSESLGVDGSDHLQFFHSLDDMTALFTPYFKTVALREVR